MGRSRHPSRPRAFVSSSGSSLPAASLHLSADSPVSYLRRDSDQATKTVSNSLTRRASTSTSNSAMRSSVVHAVAGTGAAVAALLGRPVAVLSERPAPRLTRLLVNVTVERSLWPVHVVLGADATVADLARAAVAAYVAEGRRPPLPASPTDDGDAAARFELHLSKYSLDPLEPEEKVLNLGSRNFFLCAARGSATACGS